MVKANTSHEISLLNASAAEVGFMIHRNSKTGLPMYTETTDPALAQQFFSEEPDYSYTPPERAIKRVFTDHRGGFGQEYYDTSDTKRYFYGINYDTRFKDMGIPAPLATAISRLTVTTLSITNADMELDANWTNGGGGGTTARSSNGQGRTGSYSWSVLTNGADEHAQQDIYSAVDIRGREIKITGWAKKVAGGDGVGSIKITDDGGTSTSNTHTGAAAWEELTVTRTIDAAATVIEIELFNDFQSVDSTYYYDDLTIGQPTKGDVKFIDFNSNLYVIDGNILMKGDGTLAAFTYVHNWSEITQVTDLKVITVGGADYLMVCLGWSNAYEYLDTSDTVTATDLANSTAKFFGEVATVHYQVETNSTFRKNTAGQSPLAAGDAWAVAVQVGDDTNDILGIQEYRGTMFFQKEDRVYYEDSSGDIQILTDALRPDPATATNSKMFVAFDKLYISYGSQDLIEVNSDFAVSHRSPSLYQQGASDFTGSIDGLTGDAHYLYAVLDNSAKIEVMCGRSESVDGTADWRWHTLNELTLGGCSDAHISSIYKKRLWVGSTTTTDSIYWYPTTTEYGSITSDSDYTYQTGGYLVTPYHHFNFKDENKSWVKLTLLMSGTTANIYYKAYYWKLGDSSWTEISSAAAFKTSPSTSGYIPSVVTTAVTSPMMRFKFEAITNDSSTPPVLLGYIIEAIWWPAQREIILCQVEVTDHQLLRNGSKEVEKVSVRKAVLDELYNPASAWPRTFYPWRSGAACYVKALPPKNARILRDEKGEETGWLYDLALEKVTLA